MKILQVNLRTKVPYDELMDDFRKVAPRHAAVDGLVWKIGMLNEEKGTAGGIYYFKDKAKLDKYLGSDFHKQMFVQPAFDVMSVKTFDVIEEVSKVTRAPI